MASEKRVRRLDDASRRRFIAFVRAEIAELPEGSAWAKRLARCSDGIGEEVSERESEAEVRNRSHAGPDVEPAPGNYVWGKKLGLLCSHPTRTGAPCRRLAQYGSRCQTHREKAPDSGAHWPGTSWL